jgi:hypothetical protein
MVMTLRRSRVLRKIALAFNGEPFFPLDRLVQCKAAVWTLNILQGQPLPSSTSRLDLCQ